MHLVVGDGLIGSAIARVLGPDAIMTSRRIYCRDDWRYLDLRHLPARLPPGLADRAVAYLCAGVNGFAECEGNRESWRINVDGVLGVAGLLRYHMFVVYVSSGAVEWSDNAYARQRAAVELGLRALCTPAILRADKVTTSNVADFAAFAIEIARCRAAGVHNWPPLERAALKEAS